MAEDSIKKLSDKTVTSGLDGKEMQKILGIWNQTQADYPREKCLHSLVIGAAEKYPDKTALIFKGGSLTYSKLLARASKLANYLSKCGVGPDVLVGLCVERSLDVVVGALGIQIAGGAYVPLDPAFPSNRIELVLEDAAAPVLVTEKKQLETLKSNAKTVCIDSDWQLIEEEDETPPSVESKPQNLAYVIYTSGSTGRPKGVQIEHAAVVNFLNSMQKIPGLKQEDTLLAVTTLSFDISILELYLPLITGARAVILADDQTTDGEALIEAVEQYDVSMLQATPASWRLMLESGWKGSDKLRALCGGEPLPADLAQSLIPRCHELWNMYGPTETTIWSTCSLVTDASDITIGRPIDNTEIYILDNELNVLPVGSEGELMIGGDGLARGYNNLPEMTGDRFIPHPFKEEGRIYRTGDLARYREDGTLICLGRMDDQIKLHGYRIELGEIETHLLRVDSVSRAVCVLREDRPGYKRLVAYYKGSEELAANVLRQTLLESLPEYMVPSIYMRVDEFPLTPNGKLDRKSLPAPLRKRPPLASDFIIPAKPLEKELAACWCEVLDLDEVGINDSFFDLGGTSLLAARMVNKWKSASEHEITLVKLFQYPTIGQLSHYLSKDDDEGRIVRASEERVARVATSSSGGSLQTPVAIVGMVGRFPGADDLDQLWENLCNGIESITTFKREELGVGIDESLRFDPDYVPCRGIIEGAELFDARFFGISPLEASVMDPQQRLFLEMAHEVLEHAGYDPERSRGPIGVYAGAGDNHYYTINLLSNPDVIQRAGKLVVEYGNEKDYIALRVAYALGLTGPAVSANTACSTSLLSVDNAVQGLASFDCDLALAGGIDICVPQKSGFYHEEGGAFTRDGHCKPFDSEATGTMFCDGAGLVALKRLDDALADNDTIYGVVVGSAKNNNGARAATFLAPSVDGQVEVISMAQARAGVPVETIGYVEAHGTGTPIGDPIETEALMRVFGAKTKREDFCYIGSIKGHIGHPTNAAGIAGFIKAAMVLHREQIPPTHHFKNLNPKINFNGSPFKIAAKLVNFPRTETPRRSAVSSFGFGGTNVHAVLEEAPPLTPTTASSPVQLLTLSAKSKEALQQQELRLADYLESEDVADIADVAYTLVQGRRQLAHRRIVAASTAAEAAALLRKPKPGKSASRLLSTKEPAVTFLFGGQGTQYVNMGLNLYQGEPLFRTVVDECCECVQPYLPENLFEMIYPAANEVEQAKVSLKNTQYTQPAIFIIEYAIARFWLSLGVQPAMMAGHSLGEFVAATIAGVFSLADALRIIAERGKLMQSMEKGAMLSVRAPRAEVEELLPETIHVAADNAPSLCVVSGTFEDIDSFVKVLEEKEMASTVLQTSHAFHSFMMEPMLDPLREEFKNIKLQSPQLPFVSTMTGKPITDEQACDPEYWVMHTRRTVQFAPAIKWLLANGYDLFLECGPRTTMCMLSRQHATPDLKINAIASMGSTHEGNDEWYSLLMALGSLWLHGVAIDWDGFYAYEVRRRVPLPTYPFERKRYWVEPALTVPGVAAQVAAPQAQAEVPTGEVEPLETMAVNQLASGLPLLEVQKTVLDILATAWGCEPDQIGIEETFIEQGFDSLSLTQVSSSIRREFKVKVTFGQLAEELATVPILAEYVLSELGDEMLQPASVDQPVAPQVAQPASEVPEVPSAVMEDSSKGLEQLQERLQVLEKTVAALAEASTAKESEPIPKYLNQGARQEKVEIPLTEAQKKIWLACQSDKLTSISYNESFSLRLTGRLQRAALRASLKELCLRHDALRISFSPLGDRQVIHSEPRYNFVEQDLQNVSEQKQKEALEEQVQLQDQIRFNLTDGPLVTFQLIQLGPEDHLLHFTIHNIVLDGWSAHVLIIELGKIYSARTQGQPSNLPPAMQFREYVDWYFQPETRLERDASGKYWHDSLMSGDLDWSIPVENDGEESYDAQQVSITFGRKEFEMIKKGCSELNSTLNHFLFCTFNLFLHQLTGQPTTIVGVPFAGQLLPAIAEKIEAEQLVGHCLDVLPVGSFFSGGETFSELLTRTRHQLISVRSHQFFSLEEAVNWCDSEDGHCVLPQDVIVFNHSDDPPLTYGDLAVVAEYPRRLYLYSDILVNIREFSDKLEITLDFNCNKWQFATVSSWLQRWKKIIKENWSLQQSHEKLSLFQVADLSGAGKLDVALASLEGDFPPVPGARLGKDPNGKPGWYIVDPENKDNYLLILKPVG